MSTPYTVDIIIPVYNRAVTLKQTLKHLVYQQVLPNWRPRVILVDDGSTEKIEHISYPAPWQPPLSIHTDHQGIAHARNAGLKQSNANLIFFLGADIVLQPDALAHHLRFYETSNKKKAALGIVMWDPALQPTAYMEWMVHGGSQNDFDSLLGKKTANPATHFFASHISIPRELLQENIFDEEYKGYGWEDLDMGQSLFKKGVQMQILHSAIGFHHHFYNVDAVGRRQYYSGISFARYSHIHFGGGGPIKLSWTRYGKHLFLRYSGIIILITYILKTYPHRSFPSLFLLFSAHWFLRGMWKGKKALKRQKNTK